MFKLSSSLKRFLILYFFQLKQGGSGVNLIVAEPHDALQIYQEAFELVSLTSNTGKSQR